MFVIPSNMSSGRRAANTIGGFEAGERRKRDIRKRDFTCS